MTVRPNHSSRICKIAKCKLVWGLILLVHKSSGSCTNTGRNDTRLPHYPWSLSPCPTETFRPFAHTDSLASSRVYMQVTDNNILCIHVRRLLGSHSSTWPPSFTEVKELQTIWELKPVCWLTGAGVTTGRYTHAREVLLPKILQNDLKCGHQGKRGWP